MMAEADFDSSMSLAAAMGLRRCIHGARFPCAQCRASRSQDEATTGQRLTDRELEERYAKD